MYSSLLTISHYYSNHYQPSLTIINHYINHYINHHCSPAAAVASIWCPPEFWGDLNLVVFFGGDRSDRSDRNNGIM